MSAKNSNDLDSDPCSIIGSGLLDAPRELVFSAFTDPEHLAHGGAPTGSRRRHIASSFGQAVFGVS